MKKLSIKNIKVITTRPHGRNLVVAKVETEDPSIYGLGCGTFHQRYAAVEAYLKSHLVPLLIGRDPANIEEIWQVSNTGGYWRTGPIHNNAVSAIDMALWDIKGKMADMPVYQLLGGQSRAAIPAYVHARADTQEEVAAAMRAFMAQGYKHLRCQIGEYGGNAGKPDEPEGLPEGNYFDPVSYMRETVELFKFIRREFPADLQLLHDVHDRLSPIQAIQFAKQLEPFNLFYLEDVLPPDQQDWYERIRQQVSTPIAMGELYSNPYEWKKAIENKWIDYIRCHISDIGGITAARKVATFAEYHGVKTAWHGPTDISPLGMAANIHLDMSVPNVGIQEYCVMNKAIEEVFPGVPAPVNGYWYPIDRPGLGVDLNEELALEYPCKPEIYDWTNARLPDGTSVYP